MSSDSAISTINLKKQESSLKNSQTEEAHKLMNYLSNLIGFKLSTIDAYSLSLEMKDTNPVIKNLMSNLEKITTEQKHVSELVKEVEKHLSSSDLNRKSH